MTRVGIVTDSTCDMLPSELERLAVAMVPLKVLFGDQTYLDWVDLAPEAFYERLKGAAVLPKTSQPSPAEFLAVYRRLADEGCEEIVSVHLTSALSGTFASAQMAAADSQIPVHLVDTKKVTQGVALAVRAACAERDAGSDGATIARVTTRVSESMKLYFVLDTLEYLVKGGRAGKAQGLAASLLNIKPVLCVNDEGIVEPFKKVKGRKKAVQELAAHVAEDSRSNGKLRLAILHACAPERAEELKAEFDAAGADYELDSVGLVGAVIGTYAGPDAVGCAYYPIR